MGRPQYLAHTRAALAARDGAGALQAALAAWRETRSPAIASLVDRISAKISGPPILDEREWTRVAVVKDPIDLGRLLPAIPHLPGRLLPAAGGTLAAFDDDPRLAIAIGAWSRDPPVTSKTLYAFWTAVLGAAVRIADTRVIAMFEERLAMPQGASVFWPRLYAALTRAVDKLRVVPPAPEVDEVVLARCLRDVEKLAVVEPRVHVESVAQREAPLARAVVELAAGRIAPAIDHMLDAWRHRRAPELADVIDRATRLLPAYDRPLAPTVGKVHGAWMDALRRDSSGSFPQLVQYINVGSSAQAERRLLELGGLPDDPRIAMRLVELASMADVPPNRNQYWRSLYELVARIRDVRTCEPLRRQVQDFVWAGGFPPHRHAKRYVTDLVLAPPMAPRLDDESRVHFTRLEAELAAAARLRDRTEHELLAAIAEDRSDVGPYLVYADWLLEREHPRGSLIEIACRRERTGIARYNQLTLLPYVFGFLQDFARAMLDHGLPRRLYIRPDAGMTTWRTVVGLPLATLADTLRFAPSKDANAHRPKPDEVAELVLHPTFARVRFVEDLPIALVDEARLADRFTITPNESTRTVVLSRR